MLTLTPPQAWALLEEITGLKDQKLADAVGVSLDTVKRGKSGTRMSHDTKDLYKDGLSKYFTEQDNRGLSTAIRKYVVWVKGRHDYKLLCECLDRLTEACNLINPGESYEFNWNNIDNLDLKIFDTVTKADETDFAIEKIIIAVVDFIDLVDNQKIEPPNKATPLDPTLKQDCAICTATVDPDDTSQRFSLNLLRDVLYEGSDFTSWANLTSTWHPVVSYPGYEFQDNALYLQRLFSLYFYDYEPLNLDDARAIALCNGQPTPAILGTCFNFLNNDNYLRIALSSAATLVRGDDTYNNLCKAADVIFATSKSDPSAYNIFLRCTSLRNSSKALLLLALFALFHDEHYEHFAKLVGKM